MNKWDAEKVKAVLLYFIQKSGGQISYYRAFKFLYFATLYSLKDFGRTIVADKFYALPCGHVPSFSYDVVKKAIGRTDIFNRDNQNIDLLSGKINMATAGERMIQSSVMPDMDELSRSDLQCLDRAFDNYCNYTDEDLECISHAEAWNKALVRSSRVLDILDMAKEAGSTPDMIEYIRNKVEFDQMISA
ncbi:MAG: Panacea domain-containing protein [Bacteroidales bacterium]